MPIRYFIDGQGSDAVITKEDVPWNSGRGAFATYAEAARALRDHLRDEEEKCRAARKAIPRRVSDVSWSDTNGLDTMEPARQAADALADACSPA